jgi:hypothetical protein
MQLHASSLGTGTVTGPSLIAAPGAGLRIAILEFVVSVGSTNPASVSLIDSVDGSPITQSIYTHVVSEDGRKIAEKLGEVVWSKVLDHFGPEKGNGLGAPTPKPFRVN